MVKNADKLLGIMGRLGIKLEVAPAGGQQDQLGSMNRPGRNFDVAKSVYEKVPISNSRYNVARKSQNLLPSSINDYDEYDGPPISRSRYDIARKSPNLRPSPMDDYDEYDDALYSNPSYDIGRKSLNLPPISRNYYDEYEESPIPDLPFDNSRRFEKISSKSRGKEQKSRRGYDSKIVKEEEPSQFESEDPYQVKQEIGDGYYDEFDNNEEFAFESYGQTDLVREEYDDENHVNDNGIAYDISALPLPLDFDNPDPDTTLHDEKKDIKAIKREKEEFSPEDGDSKPKKKLKLKKEKIKKEFDPGDNNTSGELIENVKQEPGELVNRYQCTFCEHITVRAKYLQRHLREKHDVKISVHSDDPKKQRTKNLGAIKEHISKEGENYNCKTCEYTTTRAKYIKRHVRARHLPPDLACLPEDVRKPCPHCNDDKTYKRQYLLRHIREHHDENAKIYACDRNRIIDRAGTTDGNPCPFKTKRSSRLKVHIKYVHEGVKDQQCEQCDKVFKRKEKLKLHQMVAHEGIKIERKYYPYQRPEHKPHVCHLCTGTPFASAAPSGLKFHIDNVHLKLGASICPHCDHRTTREKTMRKHIKFVHEKCADFECKKCGYLFSDKIKLANHTKAVHDRIKDRICEHCGAGFSNRFGLADHVKVIHLQIREFRCDECGYESATRSNLKKHLIQMNHTSTLDRIPSDFDVKTLSMISTTVPQPSIVPTMTNGMNNPNVQQPQTIAPSISNETNGVINMNNINSTMPESTVPIQNENNSNLISNNNSPTQKIINPHMPNNIGNNMSVN